MHIVFFFHSQLVGATLFLLKQSFVLFHSKFLCEEPNMCNLRLLLITHSCFTLKLQAARRNTDKICYDEGTMVL